jgi:hypothetical protein
MDKEEKQEHDKSRWRNYYALNKEMLLENRRVRYQNDPEYCERVKAAQEKYWNKPGVRAKRNRKSLEKYHADMAIVQAEREVNSPPDAVDVLMAVHDDILRKDPERLTARFLKKLIRRS